VRGDAETKQTRRRLRNATAKLRLAERELGRAERKVAFWRRRVSDLRFEHAAQTQRCLWADDK
jgi:hypothetical protein